MNKNKGAKMKKVYIAGKITGNSNANIDFTSAEAYVKQFFGFCEIFNPLKRINPNQEYVNIIKDCLGVVASCDVIVLLPNYKQSYGAQIEHLMGCALGKTIFFLTDIIKKLELWEIVMWEDILGHN